MTTALLIIDMQMGMMDRIGQGRDHVNGGAPALVAGLLTLFRDRDLPVIHVHHNEPGTRFAPGAPAAEVMPEAAPMPGEMVVIKSTSSAFAGTGLADLLHERGIDRLVIVGAVAAYCVTSSIRAASDLGFQVLLPSDAVLGFDIERADGSRIDAAIVLDVTLTLLGSDFAEVLPAKDVASRLS